MPNGPVCVTRAVRTGEHLSGSDLFEGAPKVHVRHTCTWREHTAAMDTVRSAVRTLAAAAMNSSSGAVSLRPDAALAPATRTPKSAARRCTTRALWPPMPPIVSFWRPTPHVARLAVLRDLAGCHVPEQLFFLSHTSTSSRLLPYQITSPYKGRP